MTWEDVFRERAPTKKDKWNTWIDLLKSNDLDEPDDIKTLDTDVLKQMKLPALLISILLSMSMSTKVYDEKQGITIDQPVPAPASGFKLPIVPFGKYKGEPMTKLMEDSKYLDWAKSSGALQKQAPNIYQIIVQQTLPDNAQPTPMHNKFQNMFMDQTYLSAFMSDLIGKDTQAYIPGIIDPIIFDVIPEGIYGWDLVISPSIIKTDYSPIDTKELPEHIRAYISQYKTDLLRDYGLALKEHSENYLKEARTIMEPYIDFYSNCLELFDELVEVLNTCSSLAKQPPVNDSLVFVLDELMDIYKSLYGFDRGGLAKLVCHIELINKNSKDCSKILFNPSDLDILGCDRYKEITDGYTVLDIPMCTTFRFRLRDVWDKPVISDLNHRVEKAIEVIDSMAKEHYDKLMISSGKTLFRVFAIGKRVSYGHAHGLFASWPSEYAHYYEKTLIPVDKDDILYIIARYHWILNHYVELKPCMADEYPFVLRQIKSKIALTETHLKCKLQNGQVILAIQQYCGAEPLDTVKKIFSKHNIRLVLCK